MIVESSRDPLGRLGYDPKEGDLSTKEGNRRDPLIGVGDNSTRVGFCQVPDRACWIRATASPAEPGWPWGSGVGGPSWSTIRLMGTAENRLLLTWGSGNASSDGGVSEPTMMGPIDQANVLQSAVREDAAFVRSITLVDGSIIARFSALIMVFVHEKGNCGPLSSL